MSEMKESFLSDISESSGLHLVEMGPINTLPTKNQPITD